MLQLQDWSSPSPFSSPQHHHRPQENSALIQNYTKVKTRHIQVPISFPLRGQMLQMQNQVLLTHKEGKYCVSQLNSSANNDFVLKNLEQKGRDVDVISPAPDLQ